MAFAAYRETICGLMGQSGQIFFGYPVLCTLFWVFFESLGIFSGQRNGGQKFFLNMINSYHALSTIIQFHIDGIKKNSF
jgi:hypothetical protein